MSGLLGLAEDVKAYLQLLGSFLEQQTHFVRDQKLTKQKVSCSAEPSLAELCHLAKCR